MRVIVADDEVLLRDGLGRLLADSGIDVVARVGSADEMLAVAAHGAPDAVILDIRMPPSHTDEGLVAADTLRDRHPGVGIVLLSHHLDSRYAIRLMQNNEGGVGYLLKERVSELGVLLDALKRVCEGECVVDPTIVANLVRRRQATSALADLSPRELQVLALMAEGRSNAEICGQLFLSPKTIEAHIRRIFVKLGLDEDVEGHRRVLAVLLYLRST
jgi:DNA-binding NarL/FixJ family response regulator